jgi:hypothetical protein
MNVLAYGGGNTSGNIDVAACLTAKGQRIDFEVETFAVHGTQDPTLIGNWRILWGAIMVRKTHASLSAIRIMALMLP